MYFTYQEIKKELIDHREEIQNNEDLLTEFADGFVPVYYNEIIKDWVEMPSDWNDSWQDHGVSQEEGILKLMAADLFFYYLDTTNRAWQEILEEAEEV